MGTARPQETGSEAGSAPAENSAGHVLKSILGSTLEQQVGQLDKLAWFWQQKLDENIMDITTRALVELTKAAVLELAKIKETEYGIRSSRLGP